MDISARPMATICCWPPDSDVLGTWRRSRQHREQVVDARQVPRSRPAELAADQQVLLDRERGEQPAPFGHERDAARRPPHAQADRRSARRRTGCASRRDLMAPAMHLSSVDLPAPLAPMTATTSPGATLQRNAEQRLEVAVEGVERPHVEERLRHRRGFPCRFRAPPADLITVFGSPSPMKPPPCSTSSRSTTAMSACTTCSIQMIETPLRRMLRIRSTSAAHSCSVRPPATSSRSSSARLRRQRAGEFEPLAVEQREPAGRPVGLVGEAALLEQLDAARIDVALAAAAAERRRHDQVLEHGHAVERLRNLERAADAHAAAPFRRQAA